ncbi:methyltransferase domain-containing protein [Candidatus Venteria ishoeyi]|uniref:methyltransferase domain-containing protein n=1 Tax=Candidatus Venteria ishoeyi TaxID=1899563 RepID=UPI0025A6458D|nr:methyltransferase domain-containing protein [Candidatus Venteria ishoeyi]MDM8546029.1 methyltransferase domain-containing protein [Candidatus Venteria ishoeyi]
MDDPQRVLQQRLLTYQQQHPKVVTPVMLQYWQQWLSLYFSPPEKKQSATSKTPVHTEQQQLREYLANQYLRGAGIEIGALHNPIKLPSTAQVSYLDHLPNELLRLHYPELCHRELVPVDIIDDGEQLNTVADNSQDFLVANHFLEHCENPLRSIQQHFRVLKPEGILYYALPDKRFTFDKPREVTPFEHLLRDDQQGVKHSRAKHYQDWSLQVNQKQGDEHEAWWRFLEIADYSIHFHVWEQKDMLELLLRGGKYLGVCFEFEAFFRNQDENIFILKKIDS